jgi:phosphatidylglycerol:prolipoprotein diacylglycerol transferase
MAIPFPNIDPVAFTLEVKWYGIAYGVGFVLGWLYMRKLVQNAGLWRGNMPMTAMQVDDFLIWAVFGTILGGRVGFFLLYEPSMFIHEPWRFFYLWKGGMAFHGGLVGVCLAVIFFARVNRVLLWSLADLCAAVVPIGLFFGRIANFINAEMYGRLTNVPWAVEFPHEILARYGHAFGPRHPTQIYEALLEGLLLFVALAYLTRWRKAFHWPGLAAGVFFLGYGAARIFAEYFKEWDMQQFFTTAYFSEGMVYSLPMLAFGAYLVWQATQKQAQPAK